jgi:hypothetical protein
LILRGVRAAGASFKGDAPFSLPARFGGWPPVLRHHHHRKKISSLERKVRFREIIWAGTFNAPNYLFQNFFRLAVSISSRYVKP